MGKKAAESELCFRSKIWIIMIITVIVVLIDNIYGALTLGQALF